MGSVFFLGLVDLFGDPVPVSRGKRGRPAHVPTAENRRFVQLALACGKGEDEIAAGLRITERTLNRHYFHELAGKASARLRLDMKNMAALVQQVEAGKTAAMALLSKRLDKIEKRELADRYQVAAPREPKLGKKDAAKAAAKGVDGIYAPPPAPLLN